VTIAILIAVFAVLVLLGIPIAFSMGLSSIAAILFQGNIPFNVLVHRTVMGVDSFVLLAIPLFIFAGTLMEEGGLSARLIHFAQTLLGRFRGGLPMGVVVGTMLESGVSGSTVADVSAMATMTLKPLERAGYPRPYSLSVIGASAAFAILIPPCILMVIVAAIANVSVVALFAAGLLPSVLMGALVLGLIHIQARMYNMPRDKAYSGREILRGLKDAALALGIPIVIFGGIRLGIATVTEMAAITVVYALIVGGLIYRNLTWLKLRRALVQTAIATGIITMLMGLAMIFGYLLATQGIPMAVAGWMKEANIPPWGVLVISALIFVFIGSILEGAPAALIFVPILMPLVRALEIDVVHWLTIVVLASGIGLFLPPTGIAVLMACSIGGVKMEEMFKPMLPFLGVLFLGMTILIFFPWITTVVPRLLELPY
jgi:tripartite ATP-independent transporter DctM subunit